MLRRRPSPLSVALLTLAVAGSWAGCAGCSSTQVVAPSDGGRPDGGHIKTVFLVLMENNDWSNIFHSSSAPYINHTLLPMAAYATQAYNPPGNHPSEPNYIWLAAGKNFGVSNDNDPCSNHISSTQHLADQLNAAGFSWKSYQESIDGGACPIFSTVPYAAKHNPFVFFDDAIAWPGSCPSTARWTGDDACIAHNRPFPELSADLASGKVADFNFITPNLCDDMHGDPSCGNVDLILAGDTWLSQNVPAIVSSSVFQKQGLLIITWDEGESGGVDNDGPIGLIVISPFAKDGGYSNAVHYTHSSTLRTVQDIFGLRPYLGDAANATNLGDLFKAFP